MNFFLCEPYLLSLKPDSEMNIIWMQSTIANAFVEYGSDDSLGKKVKAECYELKGLRLPNDDGTYSNNPYDHREISVWQYIVKITDLNCGEKVYYRVHSEGNFTDIYSFHTSSKEGESYKFIQLSDLQGLPDCNKTVYKAGCQHPDFILYSGDTTYVSWRLDSWFDLGEPWQSSENAAKAFFPSMQQRNGARLMQYCPTFVCPGNHELDDIRVYGDKELYKDKKNWSTSIYLQMFRPLYNTDKERKAERLWYSADYADMHIVSLSINRLYFWDPYEAPGWPMYDSIEADSPQIKWLINDLSNTRKKYKWIIQHFHMLNKGWDVQFNLCDPVFDKDGNISYPNDNCAMLIDIYGKYGVNAVTFGHSHVYERYYANSTHYIEAAYLSVCFRRGEAEPHPSGLLPIVEDNSQRSYLTVEHTQNGLVATGRYAEPNEEFDRYIIADENGVSVTP